MRSFLPFLLSALLCFTATAQDDLEALLDIEQENTINYVSAIFKSTRLINSHTVSIESPGELQFLISHRFGTLNSGAANLWGLDEAFIRLGFEYGISPRWAIGLGRSSNPSVKPFDLFSKFKLLRQSTGAKNMPVSLILHNNIAWRSESLNNTSSDKNFTQNLIYTQQLIVARKFNSNFSLQLMPTYMHRNLVNTRTESNDIFALGLGVRLKFSTRFGVVAEYYYVFDEYIRNADGLYNSLSLALEIETGGHVFHLTFSNSLGLTENQFIANTTSDWLNGGIRFGFNISRVFQLTKNH